MVYLLSAFLFALHKRGGHITGRCPCSSFGNALVMFTGAFWVSACTSSPWESLQRYWPSWSGICSSPVLLPPAHTVVLQEPKAGLSCVDFTLLPTLVGSSRKAVCAAAVSAESRISSFPGAQPQPRSDCAFEASQHVKQCLYLRGLASLKTPKTKPLKYRYCFTCFLGSRALQGRQIANQQYRVV